MDLRFAVETPGVFAGAAAMYASKRRQRNFKRVRESSKASTVSNPSKRHRERLNGELETVAQLLPYDQTTLSRLDKLSVLRLAVSFLQCKAHFAACLDTRHRGLHPAGYAFSHSYQFPTPVAMLPPLPYHPGIPSILDARTRHPLIDPVEADFETLCLKALGGFILVLNDNGEIYYASENVEKFLGFQQHDLLHLAVDEMIHSEDRADVRAQLAPPPPDVPSSSRMAAGGGGGGESFSSASFDRNVNARFRSTLDNTCGFLRMDVRGKLIPLLGLPQSYVVERAPSTHVVLGLLAVCTPFVPPSTADLANEEMILKTKHHLDASVISMDDRMYSMLEVSESELPLSFYTLVHPADASCLAEAHKEVVKSGSSGLLVYRLLSRRSGRVYFVQSSARVFCKNGKADAIGLTHRLLNEVEGTLLLEKRATLKTKLLSFDDSLLQAPRALQSTAALPVPAAASAGSAVAAAVVVADQQKPCFSGGSLPLTVSAASTSTPAPTRRRKAPKQSPPSAAAAAPISVPPPQLAPESALLAASPRHLEGFWHVQPDLNTFAIGAAAAELNLPWAPAPSSQLPPSLLPLSAPAEPSPAAWQQTHQQPQHFYVDCQTSSMHHGHPHFPYPLPPSSESAAASLYDSSLAPPHLQPGDFRSHPHSHLHHQQQHDLWHHALPTVPPVFFPHMLAAEEELAFQQAFQKPLSHEVLHGGVSSHQNGLGLLPNHPHVPPAGSAGAGFNFMSEVTNTLLSQ